MPTKRKDMTRPTNAKARKIEREPIKRAAQLVRFVNGIAINANEAIGQLRAEGYSTYTARMAVKYVERMTTPEIVSNTIGVSDACDWLYENCGVRVNVHNLTHEIALGNVEATIDLRTTPEALRKWVETRPGHGGKPMGKIYVFDLFGTLTRAVRKPVKVMEDQEFMPGVMVCCAYLRDRGHKLAIASNQGAVAYGILTVEQARKLVEDTAEAIGASAWRVCPHHPDGDVAPFNKVCGCRKPNPNMLRSIQSSLVTFNGQKRPLVYVGDTAADEETAINAGAEFERADAFFRRFVAK